MRYREYRNLEKAYENQSRAIHKSLAGQLAPTKEQYLRGRRNAKIRKDAVNTFVHAAGTGNNDADDLGEGVVHHRHHKRHSRRGRQD